MADIELVIKMPEQLVQYAKCGLLMGGDMPTIATAISNGVALPKGHGRLIDGDALYDQYRYADYDFDKTMEYAPTIIEADKTESEET